MYNVSATGVQLKILNFCSLFFLTGLFHYAYLCIGRKKLPSAIQELVFENLSKLKAPSYSAKKVFHLLIACYSSS